MPTSAATHEYMTIDRFHDDPGFADQFYSCLNEVVIIAGQFSHEDLYAGLDGPTYEVFNNVIEGECEDISMQQGRELWAALRRLLDQRAASAG